MSSYDVYFAAPPGAPVPTVDALRAWLSERPRWKVDGDQAEYDDPRLGVDLHATIEANADAPADRVPLVVWMTGLRAHHAIEEMVRECAAIAEAFDLILVEDRDENTTRPFDPSFLRAEHEKFNRAMHDFRFRHLGEEPGTVLARARLDDVMRWNAGRDALARAMGDDVFVPEILFFERSGEVGTFIAWADGIAACVPRVDAIQTTRSFVPWSAIEAALAGARREDDHWQVDDGAVRAVFAAVDAAPGEPPPRIVPPREVLTKELVALHTLPEPERAARRRAMELLSSGRMASFMGTPEKEAVAMMIEAADLAPTDLSVQLEVARFVHEKAPRAALRIAERVLESNPDYVIAALIGAANAMYLARWNDAVRLADVAVALAAGDVNAHLVRATALTELMQWDDAIAACDRALEIAPDAMTRNVRAFTLAAAGRADEARALYATALAEIDAALRARPDDADLHERRAYALLGLDRPKDALAAAKKALKLDPTSILAGQSVGRAAVALGRAADAVTALRKVIARRKTSPMAALYLAKAHAALGETAERDAALKIAATSPLQADLAAKDPALASAVG